MGEGGTLTAAQAQIARSLGATANVLPMAEEPVMTRVLTRGGWRELQEFLIIDGSEPEIEAVEVQGIGDARPTPEVLQALEAADVVVIGPSNPVISIGPIVALPGMREAIAASGTPVMAVSPFVAGRAVKGPTEKFMAAVRRPPTAAGVASLYEGMITAMVVDADDPDAGPEGIQLLSCPTLMEGGEGRRELAERVLEFAEALG
jgi:LPPG:FO 2-phospho-L-lactate transferase